MQVEPRTKPSSEGRRYVRATIAYDGTEFLGFQWQAQGRTVQAVLETALLQVTQAPTRVIGSGRTDTGVHAAGQEIGFWTAWKPALTDLQRALNAVLPGDVAVLAIGPAEFSWHPRFSATRRYYRYTVLNQPWRSPLDRRYAHLVTRPLNLEAMQTAASLLVGVHDFASFGQPTQGSSTVRMIFSAEWRRDASRLDFDVIGSGFLRGMVRCLTGTLLQVGLGAWEIERVGMLLEARNRALAPPPAPACGLCLMRVDYQ
jgi:tRNA pseudouridine38-40 synthase